MMVEGHIGGTANLDNVENDGVQMVFIKDDIELCFLEYIT